MADLGVIGGDGGRLHDATPRRRSQLGHLLIQPVVQFRFTQLLVPLQMAHLFQHPLGHRKLAQQRQRLVIDTEHPLPPIAQHIDHRQPVFPLRGEISRVQRVADYLTVPVDTVHARACVIYMTPWATAQPCFHDLCFLPMEDLVAPGQEKRNLARRNENPHVGKPFDDLRLGHVAQMREHHAQSSHVRSKLAAVAFR